MFLHFEELEVYKECRLFRKMVSELVRKSFPQNEKYRLSDQIIRSSRSITANIAEGYGRFHFQENIQFCRISRGSLAETLEHLITALDEKYIDTNTLSNFKLQYQSCERLLNGYISYLKKQKSTYTK